VQIGLNLKLGDVLKHDQLFAAYPFLKQMRLSVIVGEGVPAGEAGGQVAFRHKDGGIIWNPIQVRTQSEAQIIPILLHELQHYIQQKEGFVGGSATTGREGDFSVRPLNHESTYTGPLYYGR